MKFNFDKFKDIPYCDYSFFVRGRKLRVRCVTVDGNRTCSFELSKAHLRGLCRYFWDQLNSLLYNHDVYQLPFDWKIEQSYSHDTYHDLACYLYAILRDIEIVKDVAFPYYSRPLSEYHILNYIYPDTLLKPKCINIDIEVCIIRDHSGHLLGYVPVLDSLALHAFRSVTELRDYLYSLYPLTQYKINLLIN